MRYRSAAAPVRFLSLDDVTMFDIKNSLDDYRGSSGFSQEKETDLI